MSVHVMIRAEPWLTFSRASARRCARASVVFAEGWLPHLMAASRCSWVHGSPQSTGQPWIAYCSRMGCAGWCVVAAFGCMRPIYTGWYLLWCSDSFGSVVIFGDIDFRMFLLFLFVCGFNSSWCMVVFVDMDGELLLMYVVVCSIASCMVAACDMLVLSCQIGTVVGSWSCTIIKSLVCCQESASCNQNAGARRASSARETHFSVLMAGSFVVLLVRMAISIPICSGGKGVSSCVSVQFWSPQPPTEYTCHTILC